MKVSRFLDFHLVHCVLIPTKKKPSRCLEARIAFLQRIDFAVTHMIDHNMSTEQTEVSHEISQWVRSEMDKLSEAELTDYYAYSFDPEKSFGFTSMVSTTLEPQYAGCDDRKLQEYFDLLTNPSNDEEKPFVPKPVIDYLLWQWFRVGKEPNGVPEDHMFINIDQMVFFLREFLIHFQTKKVKNKKSVSQKQLVDFLKQDLPFLFLTVEPKTIYHKFTHHAELGSNPKLDWRNSSSLSSTD